MRLTQAEYERLMKNAGLTAEMTNPLPHPVRQSEHEIQVAFFDLLDEAKTERPLLDLMYAIPNGGTRPYNYRTNKQGESVRYSREAARMKEEGQKSGIPDTHLPISRLGWNSLYIEFKTPVGTVRPKQKEMMRRLTLAGNLCIVCRSAVDAFNLAVAYLDSVAEVINTYLDGRRWLE